MASLSKESHGGRQVQFFDTNGKRRSIRLGQIPVKQAEAMLVRIEALISARAANASPDASTAAWAAGLSDHLHERLARVGLLAPRTEQHVTLGSLIERFFAALTIKPSTARTYQTACDHLREHFGAGRIINTITPTEAEGFKRAMRDAELAQATVAKFVKVARQIFRRAVKLKLVNESPFGEVIAGSMTNTARLRFVSREQIAKVMDECPTNEWQLLIALSRFGGLRCPSEHLALRWRDIDWERARITVTASKTAAHANRETRQIPLFPEIVPYLVQARKEAPQEAEFVMTDRYRRAGVNLGTQLKRFIRQAGLTPWPRAWHNLRASCQTELAATYPLHVVCHWLGNTTTVATQHYLSVRDSDYASAAQPAKLLNVGAESGEVDSASATVKPATISDAEGLAKRLLESLANTR